MSFKIYSTFLSLITEYNGILKVWNVVSIVKYDSSMYLLLQQSHCLICLSLPQYFKLPFFIKHFNFTWNIQLRDIWDNNQGTNEITFISSLSLFNSFCSQDDFNTKQIINNQTNEYLFHKRSTMYTWATLFD